MEKKTIKQIAEKLDLSIATISRAINPRTSHLVRESTRDKVVRFIESEHFIPSAAAKSLATGRSYNIAVFFRPEIASVFFDDYYSKMIAGAMAAVSATEYNLVLSVIKKEEDGGFDVEKALRGMDAAAAIVVNFLGVNKMSAKNIFNLEIPILGINQYSDGDNPNCFLIDNAKSAYAATQYLVDKGHRRIGFVRGSAGVKDAQDRYLGHLKALKDNGIAHDPRLEYYTDFLESSARDAARYFFSGKITPPSALFFVEDAMAMIALNELRAMGVLCPRDVSVMGFDGINAGRYTDPPLTTVLQPIYDMAGDAVREAIRILETKKRLKGARYFTAKIIERDSIRNISTPASHKTQ